MKEQKKSWNELPIGGSILEAGNSKNYFTGTWRTFKPVHNAKLCINCYFCWMHCPDDSIVIENGKVTGMDLDHCKGCGVCAEVCPKKAITMEKEEK